MLYRNGTYVAFDGQGTADPTVGDLISPALLRGWDKYKRFEFHIIDSNLKAAAVRDPGKRAALENRTMEKMRSSKNMLLVLSDDTDHDREMLNFEIEKGVDLYELPIIIAYANCSQIKYYDEYSERWPIALEERIEDESVNAIHIPFNEKAIMDSLSRYSVYNSRNNVLNGPYNIYTDRFDPSLGHSFR